MSKVIKVTEVPALIKDGATIGASALTIAGWPEYVAKSIEKSFLETSHPKNLTLLHASGIGDWKTKGTQHFAHPGMVAKWIGGHTGLAPDMAKMVIDGVCEGYCLPQGVICQLWREIAAKRPGVITKIGLGTFVDPRLEGGKMNKATTKEIVKVVNLTAKSDCSIPLQGGRGHHPRHHRRRVRQHDGGRRRRAAGVPAAGPGRQEQRRHRHRPGGVPVADRLRFIPRRCAYPACWWITSWCAKPEDHWQARQRVFNPAFSGDLIGAAQCNFPRCPWTSGSSSPAAPPWS